MSGAIGSEAGLHPASELRERFDLVEKVGSGGTSVVYRAVEKASGRTVALKQLVLGNVKGRRAALEALFEREYHTLARLRHPRIIDVYDYGITKDGPYYTMELLDGRELTARSPLPFVEACRHLADVASALSLLHAHRLVHRDVTSRNVRITESGRAKLIDFGALTSFGIASEIVGTAAYMAPEVFREMPLDHRADLYSLGSVAYFALTGKHPYPARTLRELPTAWKTLPPPPSAHLSGIPPELDRLVLSLLASDPLERPSSAAEVIDQLSSIAGLPAEPREHAAESYLLSSPMVGRQADLDRAIRRIRRAVDRAGGELLVEGAAGMGKTRFLDEVVLAARLKGAEPLKADAESAPSNFGVATVLAAGLLRAHPEAARRAAGSHRGVLAHLSALVAQRLEAEPEPMTGDPIERRARMQTALHEWFLAVAANHALVLAVDNLHAADDSSAAFLAALGQAARQSRLLLVSTLRTDSPIVAETPVRIIRERSSRHALGSLDAESCIQLAKALFGDATHASRIGQTLYERSLGVPRVYADLATLMVERQIAKYVSGTWVLPLEVTADELPERVDQLIAARLEQLPRAARDVLELLAVHEKPASLAVLRVLTGEGAYLALEELVRSGFVVVDRDVYRFRQQTAQRAVYEHLPEDRRRAAHLRVAETLLGVESASVGARIDAALHLHAGGEETRAASILVVAAREFIALAGPHDSPDQAARALHKMIRTYDEQGRPDHEVAPLLFSLMPLAYYSSHWRYVLEYGERAVAIGLRVTGLARAAELEPTLGREAALAQGLAAGHAAFAERASIPGFDLKAAITSSLSIIPSVTGTCGTCLDTELVKRLGRTVTPFLLFGKDHFAALMYEWSLAEVLTLQGRETEARALWERQLAAYRNPKVSEALGPGHARALQGGCLFSLGIFDTYRFGSHALETAREMEAVGVRTWAMAAEQVRLLYHAFRGESEQVEQYRTRVDLLATQGGTTWQVELFWPALFINADFLTGNTISARHTAEQLARRARELPCLQPYADAAHAAYLFLRGDEHAAIDAYRAVLPHFPIEDSVGWETTRAFYAAALNAAGQHALAKEIALEVEARLTPEKRTLVLHFLEAEQQLAIADAGLGNHAEGARRLDALLALHGSEDNALVVGRLHQARSHVARLAGDDELAEMHLSLMVERFRSTKNPALMAQCDQKIRGVPGREIRAEETVGLATVREGGDWVSLLSEEIGGAPDPCRAALDLLMQRARAVSGYLYILDGSELRIVAASQPNEPPVGVETELARRMRTFHEGDDDDLDDMSGNTVVLESAPPLRPEDSFQIVLLHKPGEPTESALGAAALEMPPQNALRLTPELLEAVVRVLDEHKRIETELKTG